MDNQLIAKAKININAPLSKVWDALINPKLIKKYMFGTDVISDWKEGSKIIWQGEWQGKTYVDNGVILRMIPEQLIQYSHFSPLSGLPDNPDNYHTVTIELFHEKTDLLVSLTQDNNQTEQEKQHSEKNWKMVLESIKKLLEN
jgi:uncharacterized protein YndB with AHSA1/START domain